MGTPCPPRRLLPKDFRALRWPRARRSLIQRIEGCVGMGARVGSDWLARKSRHRREPVVGLNVVARGGEDHGQGTIGGVATDGVQELCAQQRWSDKAEPPRNAEQRVRQIVLSVDSGRSKSGLNNEREDLAARTGWTGWTAIGCHCHPLVETSREEAQAGLT